MSDNSTVENWAFTSVKVVDNNFTWCIKNFSYFIKDLGKGAVSPEFVDEVNNVKWFLMLYPNGQDDPDHVALYVHCISNAHKDTIAKYRFALLNEKQEIVHQINWSQVRKFSQKGWGRSRFIKRSELFGNAAKFLPNDSLLILCEVKMNAGTVESLGQSFTSQNNEDLSERHLSNDFSKFWETGLYSDITLIVDDKKFLAHKFVLSSRSTFFSDAIDKLDTSKENDACLLTIDDNYHVMKEVLRYIYTSKVESLQSSIDLLAAADKYKLTGLKKLCEQNLMKTINVINSTSLLSSAALYQTHQLKTKVFNFILAQLNQVIETPGFELLKVSNPEIIAEILSATVKDNGEKTE